MMMHSEQNKTKIGYIISGSDIQSNATHTNPYHKPQGPNPLPWQPVFTFHQHIFLTPAHHIRSLIRRTAQTTEYMYITGNLRFNASTIAYEHTVHGN